MSILVAEGAKVALISIKIMDELPDAMPLLVFIEISQKGIRMIGCGR
jgi:hypothetical protein